MFWLRAKAACNLKGTRSQRIPRSYLALLRVLDVSPASLFDIVRLTGERPVRDFPAAPLDVDFQSW
jgi:hypothetical protein